MSIARYLAREFKLIGDKYLLSAKNPNKIRQGIFTMPIMLKINGAFLMPLS